MSYKLPDGKIISFDKSPTLQTIEEFLDSFPTEEVSYPHLYVWDGSWDEWNVWALLKCLEGVPEVRGGSMGSAISFRVGGRVWIFDECNRYYDERYYSTKKMTIEEYRSKVHLD